MVNKIIMTQEKRMEQLSTAISHDSSLRFLKDASLVIEMDGKQEMSVVVEKNVVCSIFCYIENGSLHLELTQQEGSKTHLFLFGRNVDLQLSYHLQEEYSELTSYVSCYHTKNQQMQLKSTHHASHTKSRQYNHVVMCHGRCEMIVDGVVPKNLHDVVCNQENRIVPKNSLHNEIHPNLWIESYDIEAEHSAYIGPFAEEVTFYLQSRGIPQEKLFQLLVRNFLLGDTMIPESFFSFCMQKLEKEVSYESR